jgi:hypothetical protein
MAFAWLMGGIAACEIGLFVAMWKLASRRG